MNFTESNCSKQITKRDSYV